MVNDLPVLLFFVHAVGQWAVADQFVDDGFEDDVEVFHQQIFSFVRADKDLSAFFEEGVAEVPELESLVGEVFIFDLVQSSFSESVEIGFKAFARDELILAADFFREAVGVSHVVQDGEEDDEQFFVKIEVSFFIHGLEIDGLSLLHDGL